MKIWLHVKKEPSKGQSNPKQRLSKHKAKARQGISQVHLEFKQKWQLWLNPFHASDYGSRISLAIKNPYGSSANFVESKKKTTKYIQPAKHVNVIVN